MSTESSSIPNILGPVKGEVGIIAGKRSFNLYSVFILPGADDGKVTVENTKLEGMKDHIVVPVTHTFMMNHKYVHRQILSFLNNGNFEKSPDE